MRDNCCDNESVSPMIFLFLASEARKDVSGDFGSLLIEWEHSAFLRQSARMINITLQALVHSAPNNGIFKPMHHFEDGNRGEGWRCLGYRDVIVDGRNNRCVVRSPIIEDIVVEGDKDVRRSRTYRHKLKGSILN